MSDSGHPKFRNDRGVPEICIGVREFECIGVSPPQDHPHIYIDMGGASYGRPDRMQPKLERCCHSEITAAAHSLA